MAEQSATKGWSSVLDSLVVAFALWTILCHLLVLRGATFATLLTSAWGVLLASVILLWLGSALGRWQLVDLAALSPTAQTSLSRTAYPLRTFIKLAVVAAIIASFLATSNYQVYWLFAGVFLSSVYLLEASPRNHADAGNEIIARTWESRVILALAILAALITLVSNRPDPDDSHFLNLAITAIDYPARALYSYDGMHGEAGLPLLANYYRSNSYELLVAVIATATGFSVQTVYYLVAPGFLAPLVIIAYWIALKELAGRWAIFGVLLVAVTLIAWGDVHRTYGNFSFVRLFQGKGVLLSIVIPATVYYAARFVRCRDGWSWLLLFLVQVAAVGCSSSGIVAGPLVAATCLFGAWRPSRAHTKVVLAGLLASSYVALVALLLFLGTDDVQSLDGFSTEGAQSSPLPSTYSSLEMVLGTEGRKVFALFAIIAAPALSVYFPRHRLILGMSIFTFFILLNPILAGLPSLLVGNMHWRVFWAIPFPLWIGLLGSGLAAYCATFSKSYGAGFATAFLIVLMLVLPGRWTLSPDNGTRLGAPSLKVPEERGVAVAASGLAGPEGRVLAPWAVSAWIPTINEHPSVVAVRPLSRSILQRAFGREEASERHFLAEFLSHSGAPGPKSDLAFDKWVDVLRARNISAVVVPEAHPYNARLGVALKAMGYLSHPLTDYSIWVQAPQR